MIDLTRTAQYLLAQAGRREPRIPPIAELAELARAYLAATGTAETLGQAGAVLVSLAAAEQYAAAEDLGVEDARRELTELLLDARENQAQDGRWRARSKSSGLDLTARVARDGRLLVVTSIDARDHVTGRGRRG